MRRGGGIALVVVAVLVVVVGVFVGTRVGGHQQAKDAIGPFCAATVDGRLVELSPEQAENAALITAISVQRGMPARAASIALATAYQESQLVNLKFGDRDSLGLFQQRPSQGWGTRQEILDPEHATNAFYDALDRVPDYEGLAITVAAQRVQHSAFPDAYAAHEADARVLASSLTGNSPATFSCHLNGRGIVGSVGQVRDEVGHRFGLATTLAAPSGLDVPVDGRTTGWAVAQYLVAQAARLGISSVSFDGRTWTRRGSGGVPADWRRTPAIGASLVHVDTTR